MSLEIRNLDKSDYKKAIRFAIKGMHFDWYLNSSFLLEAYGRYFWYLEMNRATEILAAYSDGIFAGVLLAEIYGEEKKHQSWYEKLYVRFVDIIQRTFFKHGAGLYEETVKDQLSHYLANNKPNGEIIFLAADPDAKIKGIGSALLGELEKKLPGKILYLHTDDACTYQFYERRGFTRVEEQDIVLEMPKGRVPLKCFIYVKHIT
jgi:ribosomal protein S18 acetylase RimI-like enzyme